MNTVRDTVDRLAQGSPGRTEADIQSDVRKFLLDAPLDLRGDQLHDISLESQAGGGRRIDIEAGCAVIEVKKSLQSTSIVARAVTQLSSYVRQRTEQRRQSYVGILTDGQQWRLYHLRPDATLALASRLDISSSADAERLAVWLESILATTRSIRPTHQELLRRLGAGSPAAELDLADLRAVYDECRSEPEVRLKRELWARLLLAALGRNFEESDELFVTHTYLVLTAELVAHEVMGLPTTIGSDDVRAMLEGRRFAVAGLHGVVEADFFDWPATTARGESVIAGIGRRLSTFDWSDVEHDVLKSLYESLIDTETRRKLGEYYTPDWLAERIVAEQLSDPVHQRLLDPACGSGTFLFWAIRRVLAACEAAGLSNREAVARVIRNVQGMDLHPVAVTLARVTYLLALTPARLADRDELTVPVFLGDSVRWEEAHVITTEGGLTVRTSEDLQLLDDELHFPEGVVEEPVRFDRLVAELADRATSRRRGAKPPSIGGVLNRHKILGASDRAAVDLAFRKLCRLHDDRRDHVWSYYIRNLARPLSFMRPAGRVDVVVGNPPWLAYRSMPFRLQRTYRALASARGLWVGKKLATLQDLSDLFVVRAIEQYLDVGGSFGFVMPFSSLSREQFAGFRSGSWPTGAGVTTRVRFGVPDDLSQVRPVLFPVAPAVVRGKRAPTAKALPRQAVRWTGRVPSHHASWSHAVTLLDATTEPIETADNRSGSGYRARFRQGAPFVPRVLLKVDAVDAGALGTSAGTQRVRSARVAVEKEPWKSLRDLEDVIERRFLFPTQLGASIVSFHARAPETAVVPWLDGELVAGADERLDEYPGVARWWRRAERLWERHRAAATRLSLVDQINFQQKLTNQFPVAKHRVVYTTSGQHLAACRLSDTSALVEQTLYWAAVDSVDEALYLCAILNSGTLAAAVAPLQSRGQHNPRHFASFVFAFPFPSFDPGDDLHLRLASLAASAEAVVASVSLESRWQFQKARRVVRQALHRSGVADDIDDAVAELVTDTASEVPDLMAALSASRQRSIGSATASALLERKLIEARRSG